MACDAASGWILDEIEDGNAIPSASAMKDVRADDYPDGFVNLLVLDLDTYAKKHGQHPIHKDIAIPAWLNAFAEEQGIDCSKVLADSLSNLYIETALS